MNWKHWIGHLSIGIIVSTALLLAKNPARKAELLPSDSLSRPEYIFRRIKYSNTYPFINYSRNVIQWQSYDAVSRFYTALRYAGYKKVKVLHFGDSHVQADIATAGIRNRLQDVFGDGGRGVFFPYATIRSHSGLDNFTYASGVWEYSKNTSTGLNFDIGMCGAGARTKDPKAGFRFIFNKFYREMNNTVLKIYCKTSPNCFDLQLRTDVTSEPIFISCKETTTPYVTVYLPKAPKNLSFEVVKSNPNQSFFEVHGISLEQPENRGVVYHSMGINGAGLSSILRQNLMDAQIRDMQPDLIVLDLGGNDFYSGGINELEYENKLRGIIERFRQAAPDVSILIVAPQDIYRFGRYCVTDCKKASEIAARVAFTSNCAFYDYYKVAGGQTSMLRWHGNGLAKSDRVHLSYAGYQVKGELYANALMNGFYHTLSDRRDSPLPVDSAFVSMQIADASRGAIPNKTSSVTPSTSPNTAPVVPNPSEYATYSVSSVERRVSHVVRPGETLGKLAQQYHVSVAQLMQWNRLKNTWIRSGDRLTILTRVKEVTPPANQAVKYYEPNETEAKPVTPSPPVTPPKPAVTKPATTAPPTTATYKGKPVQVKPNPTTNQVWGSKSKTGTYYTVKSGDNLWLIATRFNTTVDAIKRANGLYSDRLSIGQRLIIK